MPVNVFTEWGTLKEIIIGNSINFNMQGFDEVFAYLYRDQINQLKGSRKSPPLINRQFTQERQEDLDNFARTLAKEGITVKRPKQLDSAAFIKTPYFKAMVNALDAPRDTFLCIGNEIIETPPTNRNRYFEGLMLREVFMDYFRSGAHWTLAPRTRLTMESMDTRHWSKVRALHALKNIEPHFDIAFDAANCLKFGKDILMNVGNKNHELGAIWLQRHLGSTFTIHPVRVCDWHIDGSIMPLKEGVLLINPNMKKRLRLLPKPLQKWRIIEGLDESKAGFNYPPGHRQLASFNGMSINVLSINKNTVCVRTVDQLLRNRLEKAGFTVIPVQMRHCELFGGGLHCISLDVNRDESLAKHW
jgi:glycine amidinotransferase